jgi:hypothetical protein
MENLIKEALDQLDSYQVLRYPQHLYNARRALYKALERLQAQPQAQRSNRPEDLVDPFHDIQYLTNKKGL